jgi:RsiW-degrading membrane proteinase PrsW (M82 family)
MSTIDYVVGYFVRFFQDPSAREIGLAIAFGAVWLACYRPPLFKKPWLWAVLVSSAFLTLVAVCFIQRPLNFWIIGARCHEVLNHLIIWAGRPLLGGLIQEGSKMVPVVVYWRRSGKNIDPKLGLAIGAAAGAGFGILQAQLSWIGWDATRAWRFFRFETIYGFWHTFFSVAAQIAFSALAGYGLVRGRGWQFYLIASALHGLLNLAQLLFPDLLAWWPPSSLGACVYTAVLATLVTAWALWLRWRKRAATAEPEISSM